MRTGARVDSSVTNRYQLSIAYSDGAITACPEGMRVLNAAQTAFVASFDTVSNSGTLRCAYQ